MTVKVSVLLPARDAAPTIEVAVRSTLRSLAKHDELLVLDDASADATFDLASGIRDPRLRVISSAEHLGVADGLNLLLREARHEVIARMDADDVCLPWRFAVQRLQIRRRDFAFGVHIPMGTSEPPIQLGRCAGLPTKALQLWMTIENPVVHSAFIGRRSCIDAVGGYRRTPGEDWDLWLRLLSAGLNGARGPLPVVRYRTHTQQVTSSAGYWSRVAVDPEILSSRRDLIRMLGYSETVLGPAFFENGLASAPFRTWLWHNTETLPTPWRGLLQRRISSGDILSLMH